MPEARAAVARHRLPGGDFEALAAGRGDSHTVEGLLAAERSWRLVLFRALLDALRGHPDPTGPLPPVEQAWRLLIRAERRHSSEVDRLLLHPHLGTWASYTLRRLRGSVGSEEPIWLDVGYLHAMAAAAAVRAGLAFAIPVPVRDGFVVLPTLGAARLAAGPPAAAVAEVRGDGRTAVISDGRASVEVAGDGWFELRTIRSGGPGPAVSLILDDLDPYRNLRGPSPPRRLPDAQVQRWRTLLAQAWQQLTSACPDHAPALARGLSCLVPQPATERFRMMSASAGDAFGSAVMSEPGDATELAVTLVHEFQHMKLGGVLRLAQLHQGSPAGRLYAPWRDDPRPLAGVLQGVYAFAGVTEFWRDMRRDATGAAAVVAQFEFARWRQPVRATLRLLQTVPELTAAGRRLVAGLTATAEQWGQEVVPADLAAAADAAGADHRTRWRLHYLRPDPRAGAAAAAGWEAGRPAPAGAPAPAVVPDQAARRLDTYAVLTLWRLVDPAGFATLQRDPAAVGRRVSGATDADLLAAAGDLDQASQRSLAAVAADPGSVPGWAGLGLVTPAGPGRAALRDRPELVRAVYQRLHESGGGTAGPLAVATWLGGAAPPAATEPPATEPPATSR